MATILALAHTEQDGTLAKSAWEALGAAKSLSEGLEGATLAVGLIGQDLQAAADALGGYAAGRFLGVSSAGFAQARYESDATAVEALCKAVEATIVVAAGTSRFNRVLPGAGHRLGGAADLHVTGLAVENGTIHAKRWYYRQRMVADIRREGRPWILAVDPGSFEPWQGSSSGQATIEALSVDLPEMRTTVTGFQAPPSDEQTIRPDADLLFVAGAGWTKKQADGQPHTDEAASLILGFLGASKASLGGSKSMVDLSSEGEAVLPFMTHLNQVGQTGATPRHPKGLATCCHGEEPHVVGWRFVNERRAINLDANCGWAQGKADVLYVADAFEVMKKLNALLAGG